ncbi:hypothetical protein OG948_08415 [Embleya sp. NBC_00888]|uniref:hypothetical protein n=1 Tax=Embleya sp. NBC_00888 TaxID=2975960 RepID=UPI003864FD13|nr:hypothetical protein OG948_08415 [Embleya sp. NBC_00888]
MPSDATPTWTPAEAHAWYRANCGKQVADPATGVRGTLAGITFTSAYVRKQDGTEARVPCRRLVLVDQEPGSAP